MDRIPAESYKIRRSYYFSGEPDKARLHCRFEAIGPGSGSFGPSVLKRWAPSRAKPNLKDAVRVDGGRF